MSKRVVMVATVLGVLCAQGMNDKAIAQDAVVHWEELAALPDALGVAGPYAGVSGNALIVAGGANFPVSLWKDGAKNPDAKKVWSDKIYVLERPNGTWFEGGTLPRPLGYGASLSLSDRGVICIGGGDAERHFAEVFALQLREGQIQQSALPPLPGPRAFFAAAELDGVLYVAGGQEAPASTEALHGFLALDLSADTLAWRELPPWPGPARILPVLGAQDGAIFLFSGCELVTDAEGKTGRIYLTDAYRYRPGGAGAPGIWTRVADLPVSVAGAPTPAPAVGQSHLFVFGGDHGKYAGQNDALADRHPGFSLDVLAYHTITDTWAPMGTMPRGHVTTTMVRWGDRLIIPSGEIQPGIRSPAIWSATPQVLRAGFAALDFVVLALYLAALVGMGFYFSRRENTTHDYFLGGNRIPWWAAGLSIFGTQLSAITFMAIPAKAYATDWVYIVGNFMIFAIAPIVVYLYLPFFRRLNITSAYEYLEHRFNLPTRLTGSAAFILFQLGRMGVVLYLPSLALATVTGINVYACILIMGLLATFYTVLGGIEAVIWTDVIQVVVLIGGALMSLVLLAQGVDGGMSELIAAGREAHKFHAVNLSWDITTLSLWVIVVGAIFQNLVSYTSDQTVVQRYLTTRDQASAARAIWTNAWLSIPASILFYFVGTALWGFYSAHPGLLNPAGRTDDIFPWFIAEHLPAGVAGLVIAGLFAAAMSSLDSSMNSMATTITTDWVRRFKRDLSEPAALVIARQLTVALGIIGTGSAIYMAYLHSTSMLDTYFKIIGLFGGGLAGLFAAGIFTRRASGHSVLIGFFVSAATLYLVKSASLVHFYLYAFVGILACFCVAWLGGFVLPNRKEGSDAFTLHAKR